jgi:polyisoprenoid-binding protein YceI
MEFKMIRSLIFSLIFLFVTNIGFTQQEINFSNDTKFFVDGTSTLHDWTIESKQITGKIITADDNSAKIKSVQLSLKVESLKSGKSGMDSRMHDAFDTKKNPEISFTSTEVTLNSDYKSGIAKGQLTMAGSTRAVEIPFTIEAKGNNWVFSGFSDLLMTNFDMRPPTAVMGTIRAGDAVTVRFQVVTRQPEFAKAL